MSILRELIELTEAKKTNKTSKKSAAKVYHRDYMKTRNKPYRKYHEEEEVATKK